MSADVWGDVTLHWTGPLPAPRSACGADYIDGEVDGLKPG